MLGKLYIMGTLFYRLFEYRNKNLDVSAVLYKIFIYGTTFNQRKEIFKIK